MIINTLIKRMRACLNYKFNITWFHIDIIISNTRKCYFVIIRGTTFNIYFIAVNIIYNLFTITYMTSWIYFFPFTVAFWADLLNLLNKAWANLDTLNPYTSTITFITFYNIIWIISAASMTMITHCFFEKRKIYLPSIVYIF